MAQNLAWLPSVNAKTDYRASVVKYYVYGYDGFVVADAKAYNNGTNVSFTTYGVLYNYKAALTACPTGWHLPSDAEWQTLEVTLGMPSGDAGTRGWRGTNQGTQLKSTNSLWRSGGIAGTNTSGFSALPGGLLSSGSFVIVGIYAYFWTATANGATDALGRAMNCSVATVRRDYYYQYYGFSVRCIKDSN